MKKALYLFTIVMFFIQCGDGGSAADTSSEQASATTPSYSQKRANPSPEPVAAYSENVSSEMGRLNHWKFSVALYETKKTFMYRMDIQYAELSITDSLLFPDLGFLPQPAIQKGKEEYECIVGFMDNENNFRDYKQVIVDKGNVRIHTLKRYGVQHSSAQ